MIVHWYGVNLLSRKLLSIPGIMISQNSCFSKFKTGSTLDEFNILLTKITWTKSIERMKPKKKKKKATEGEESFIFKSINKNRSYWLSWADTDTKHRLSMTWICWKFPCWLGVRLVTIYFAENSKHISKIIFKCVKKYCLLFFTVHMPWCAVYGHEQCTRRWSFKKKKKERRKRANVNPNWV